MSEQTQAPEMFRVIHPNYSEFHDKRSDVRFMPTLVRNAEGHQVFVAAAIVDKATVDAHFVSRADIFRIERWTEPVVTPFVPATDRTPPESMPVVTEPQAPAAGIPAPDVPPADAPVPSEPSEPVEAADVAPKRGTAARSARGK